MAARLRRTGSMFHFGALAWKRLLMRRHHFNNFLANLLDFPPFFLYTSLRSPTQAPQHLRWYFFFSWQQHDHFGWNIATIHQINKIRPIGIPPPATPWTSAFKKRLWKIATLVLSVPIVLGWSTFCVSALPRSKAISMHTYIIVLSK